MKRIKAIKATLLAALMLTCNLFAGASASAETEKQFERFEGNIKSVDQIANGIFYGSSWWYWGGKCVHPTGEKGLGGNDSQSVALYANDVTTTNNADPYFGYTFSNLSGKFTTEFSVYIEFGNMQFSRVTWRDSGDKAHLYFYPSGDVKLNASASIGSVSDGEWNKFALTFDTDAGTVDVRINGVLTAENVPFGGSGIVYKQIKWMTLYDSNATANGCFAIDDFTQYQGDYIENKQLEMSVKEFGSSELPMFLDGELPEIEVELLKDSASVEVAYIDAYVNGKLAAKVSEEPYNVVLPEINYGKNVLELYAYSPAGEILDSFKQPFVITTQTKNTLYENDFTSDVGSLFINGVEEKGGKLSIEAVDSEHGKSAVISSEEESNVADIGPNVAFTGISNQEATYDISTDVYIPDETTAFHIQIRNPNATQMKILRFTADGNIDLLGSGGNESTDRMTEYEKNQWYNVRVVFNGSSGEYDLYIDEQLQVSGRQAQYSSPGQSGVTAIRFVMENYQNGAGEVVEGKIALDNMTINMLVDGFCATKVSSSEETDVVEPNADTLYVTVNTGIEEDILSDYITLSDENGDIPLEDISYNPDTKIITIITQAPLKSSCDYVIKFGKGMLIATGKNNNAVYERFSVASDELDIAKLVFTENNGVISAIAQSINETGFDSEVIQITNMWKDGKLAGANAKKILLGTNKSNVTLGEFDFDDYDTIDIHFVEDFDSYSPITEKTYVFGK